MKRVGALLAMIGCLGLAGPAEARVAFGLEGTIKPLQDVQLTSPSGETLYLGRRFTTYHFLLPAYLTDQGYVLAVKSDPQKFYPLPPNPQLAGLQRQGLLPDPLPRYHMTWIDYLQGYALWPALGVILLVGLTQAWLMIRHRQALARDPFYDL